MTLAGNELVVITPLTPQSGPGPENITTTTLAIALLAPGTASNGFTGSGGGSAGNWSAQPAGDGANIALASGDGTVGNAGTVSLTGGTGNAGNNAGTINIYGGLTPIDGLGGAGGAINITAGDGDGAGGLVTIAAGHAIGAVGGDGKGVSISASSALVSGVGGDFTITAGDGATAGRGGDVLINAGVRAGAGRKGQIVLSTLPTSDPLIAGALFTSGATSAGVPKALMISGG